MRIGTRSILYGAHQFAIHPWFVARAWWRLYGFPFDPRLWVAFFVHDLGYWGKPNMDGPEGERHVEWGADLMSRWFDRRRPNRSCRICGGAIWYDDPARRETVAVPEWGGAVAVAPIRTCEPCYRRAFRWRDLCLYHSRFYAKKDGKPISRLCVADKLAIVLTPAWLYLPLARATGELREYVTRSEEKEGRKYASYGQYADDDRQWYENMRAYMRRWVEEHKDGRMDTWTPTPTTELRGGERGGKADRLRRRSE